MKKKILIVEDDKNIRLGLVEIFEQEGYATSTSTRGEEVLQTVKKIAPSLIILDVMLPGKNGFVICKQLRNNHVHTPILMLTAKGQEMDKVIGLDVGADDYVTKPFQLQELLARVRALLRRGEKNLAENRSEAFTMGSATVYPEKLEIHCNHKVGKLTWKELQLLELFYKNKGKVLSRDKILSKIWGVDYYGTTRTLDQSITKIRKKMEDDGAKPQFIKTVYGVGYRFD